uniref:TSC complex subunit 1b n=1 Tax=Sinocyclocheilus rhinocerous TaxID=307959 RepID=A0A673GUA1_9TELE
MSREQLNMGDLLPLLETSDLRQLDEIKGLINEHLNTDRGSVLLNGLVDYFLETNSAQAVHILSSVREPHDKHLFDKMNECMAKAPCRLPTLTLLGHVVRKQPSWIHKITRYPLLLSLLKCLKTDTDVVVLITGVLVLITLLPMIPQAGKQHLYEFFDIFGRLASWNLRNLGHIPEVYLIHLHASVYSLFHRLYGMYPCNFVSYLRSHYSMKENMDTFEEVVKPMLEHVRIHPELVTGTKDHELDPSRWKKFEIHDIVIECAKVSLDPKEASCEEGYASMPEHFCAHLQQRPADCTASPYGDFHSSYGNALILPVYFFDLSIQPNSTFQCFFYPRDAAITEELLKLTEEKRDLAGLRGFDSPFFSTTETLTGVQEKPLPSSILGSSIRDPHNTISTPDKTEITPVDRGRVSRGPSQEHPWSFQPVFMPIEHPTHSHLHRSPSAPEDEALKYSFCSPSPSKPPPLPYEALFDLALPRAASLFVGRKTSEIVQRVALERIQRGDVGKQGEEGGVEGAVSASPLEVLDRLVQQGGDAHDKVLKRLPLPSKSADWTHFGGSVPLDELHTLRSQLLLLHNQLLYERYKREQHAVRNRRLLRRIINATALEEQNNAMKDLLNLQSVDIMSLRESLQVEQQRYRQLWDDRETVVTRLHSQIRQLQQARDDYYTKNQELQSKLQECQKRIGEMEAELQKANNKVCHTGHLLNQLTAKLSSSESIQQQLSFLNKQLLLLGEAHKLCVQELHQAGPDTSKEVQMLQTSWGKETERLKQNLLLQSQKLDAAQQRVAELETQLAKKEHLIAEQKKFLEDVKAQAKGELQASESRYHAQRRVTLALQTELLQLYSRLETEDSSATASALPAEGRHSNVKTFETKIPLSSSAYSKSPQSPRGNGSNLSPAQPMASSSPANSVNGNRDTPPPFLVEPPPHRPHSPLGPPGPLVPSDTPLTVGSYPSAKSFLGMRARELFRNKSESQCDEDEAPPPRLTGLSQGLKTELCVEAKNRDTFGSRCPERPRQQPLRIMDYNESHQEHS